MIRFNTVIVVLFLSVPHFFALRTKTDEEIAEHFSKFFCLRLKLVCPTSGISYGPPVCGYDKQQEALKTFDHECAMMTTNCQSKTMYFQTEMEKCKAREDFLEEFGNSSVDWAHGHDGFNIPILNLTEPMKIHNASHHHDFFKLIPGLVDAALRKAKKIL